MAAVREDLQPKAFLKSLETNLRIIVFSLSSALHERVSMAAVMRECADFPNLNMDSVLFLR